MKEAAFTIETEDSVRDIVPRSANVRTERILGLAAEEKSERLSSKAVWTPAKSNGNSRNMSNGSAARYRRKHGKYIDIAMTW
eukprot:CAMPEP_0184478856 /NCGR_PEP_ID=MMETSP0113_2-20130426/760_1 /TAXON_ID=91329 /ORGANISM="Norrisiella sphaerica, Strain BC52" /LENGTH=81 /DNA_ID=CAMNT_0026856775 /DNA_START=369 /DNA_END=611 /DNA_ORIENTATION=-